MDEYAFQAEGRVQVGGINKHYSLINGTTEAAIRQNIDSTSRDSMLDDIKENNAARDAAVESGAMDFHVAEKKKLKDIAEIHHTVAKREINDVLAAVQDEEMTGAEARAELETISKLATSRSSGMTGTQKENIEDEVRAAKKAIKTAEAAVDKKAIRAKSQEFVASVQGKTTEEQLEAARKIGGDDPTDRERLIRDDAVTRIMARSNQETKLQARELKKANDDSWAAVRKSMSIDDIDPRLPQATQDAMKKFVAQGGAPIASSQGTMRQLQMFYYNDADNFASYDLSLHAPDLTQTHFEYWAGKQKELKTSKAKAPALTSVRTSKGIADDYLAKVGLDKNETAVAATYRVAQSALDDFEADEGRKARPDERGQIINRALAQVGKNPGWWNFWSDDPKTIGTIAERITSDAIPLSADELKRLHLPPGSVVSLDYVINATRRAGFEINIANMTDVYDGIVEKMGAK